MTDIDRVLLDADGLLAESCLAIYEADMQQTTSDDSKPHISNNGNNNTNNNNQGNSMNNKPNVNQNNKPNVNNNQNQNNNQSNKPMISNNSNDAQNNYGFTKDDLDNPQKLKQILDKAKKEKNLRTIKTILRSGISIGSLAVANFTAVPFAVTSAASIVANLGLSLNDQKHNREMQQMVVLIDKKIQETTANLMVERDPEKQKAIREYLNSLKQAKMKLRAA